METPLKYLAQRLRQGPVRLGELVVTPEFTISHHEDIARTDLAVFSDPHEAIAIVRYTDAGTYRPLKTAPDLRHGWRLHLRDESEVLLALDFIYPAAVGTLAAFERGDIAAIPLRTTLARQTGLYAVTGRLADNEIGQIVADLCWKGCLRHILWSIEPEGLSLAKGPAGEGMPLLCCEACNLFVAAGRSAVKNRPGNAL